MLLCFLSLQQALENSGLSVVQPQCDATSREPQNPAAEGAAAETKKAQLPEKTAREKKRSILKKPIQMPGSGIIQPLTHLVHRASSHRDCSKSELWHWTDIYICTISSILNNFIFKKCRNTHGVIAICNRCTIKLKKKSIKSIRSH